MTKAPASIAALSLLILSACDNGPDPAEFGGGERGAAIAKCVAKTERADSAVTREQATDMCNCLTDKMEQMIRSGGNVSQQSLRRCATDAGIELT